MSIRESYHNDFKKLNIEQFGTRYIRRKTRATSLEEERIRKLVNAGDLNYLIQLGNSHDYHEMVEYLAPSIKVIKFAHDVTGG